MISVLDGFLSLIGDVLGSLVSFIVDMVMALINLLLGMIKIHLLAFKAETRSFGFPSPASTSRWATWRTGSGRRLAGGQQPQ